jgi:hypothetical protein
LNAVSYLLWEQTPTEEEEMNKKREQTYPAGWDEERTRKLAGHYDNQTEDEQVAEHEAAFWPRARR